MLEMAKKKKNVIVIIFICIMLQPLRISFSWISSNRKNLKITIHKR